MKFIYKSLFALALFFLWTDASATHLSGGELTWRCQPNGQYTFILKVYRDCGSGTAPINANTATINYPNGTFTLNRTSITDISPSCWNSAITCGSVPDGKGAMEEHIYMSSNIALSGTPPAAGWTFTWDLCCRPGSVKNLNNAGGIGYGVRAVMYPYVPFGNPPGQARTVNNCYDSSPEFTESAAVTQCAGSPFEYNHLASDSDLDSLYYKWADPWDDNPLGPINASQWAPGYSKTQPFPNPATNPSNGPVILDGTTGQIRMSPINAAEGTYASCFAIESWRCGQGPVVGTYQYQLIAEVFRDVALVFRTSGCAAGNNAPGAIIDTSQYRRIERIGNVYRTRVYPGDSVNFVVSANDPDFLSTGAPQSVTFTAEGLQMGKPLNSQSGCLGTFPCATVTPVAPQTSYVAPQNNVVEFNWAPDCSNLSFNNQGCGGVNKFSFSLRMQDNACDAPEISLSTLIIEVSPGDPGPPILKCVSYEEGLNGAPNSVRLDWGQPPQDSALDFNYYYVYGALTKNGPYIKYDSISDYDQLSYTLLQNTGLRHFYMNKSTGKCNFISRNSDTLSLMTLNMTALPSFSSNKADLRWNPLIPNSSLLPFDSRGVYEIWMERPAHSGRWFNVGETSTSGTITYIDDRPLCDDTLRYQIRVTDTLHGCQSKSTIQKGYFSDQLNLDVIQLDSVSVNADGNAILSWQNTQYGDVVKYHILFNDPASGWRIAETVPTGTAMPFEWTSSRADERPEQFKIVSVDSCDNQSDELLVSSHKTIFLKGSINRCDAFARLSWQLYGGDLNGTDPVEYRVVANITENGISSGPTVLFSGTGEDSVFIQRSLKKDAEYCYYVQALDASGAVTSSSNRVCLDASVPQKSRVLYVAQVTNNEDRGSVDIKAFVDGEADVAGFEIEKSIEKYGIYDKIGSVDMPASPPYVIYFSDYSADPTTTYFYRVSARPSCGEAKRDTVSNIGRNLVLKVEPNANLTNSLSWNPYEKWGGEVGQYEIYRSLNTNDKFTLVGTTNGDDSTYVDAIKDFGNESGRFCYYVVAVEANNPLGFVNDNGAPFTSLSNKVCINQSARVFVPTAFRPGSDVEVNQTFGPSMRFEEVAEYDFYILNRWGKVVFQTSEPGEEWDGKVEGEVAPTGVYVYYLKYSTLEDVPREERGTFTLIN